MAGGTFSLGTFVREEKGSDIPNDADTPFGYHYFQDSLASFTWEGPQTEPPSVPVNWIAVAVATGVGAVAAGPAGAALGAAIVFGVSELSQPTPPPVTSDPLRVLGGNIAYKPGTFPWEPSASNQILAAAQGQVPGGALEAPPGATMQQQLAAQAAQAALPTRWPATSPPPSRNSRKPCGER